MLFKQISVRLNGMLISPQTDTYHYKAYLETLMNYDREDGETVLKPQGWYNGIDLLVTFTTANLDSETPDATWTELPANQKESVKLMKAELTCYALDPTSKCSTSTSCWYPAYKS